jgi:hypothetical protein
MGTRVNPRNPHYQSPRAVVSAKIALVKECHHHEALTRAMQSAVSSLVNKQMLRCWRDWHLPISNAARRLPNELQRQQN